MSDNATNVPTAVKVKKNSKGYISQEQLTNIVDWDLITKLITEGNCQVSRIAVDINANPIELRNLISAHFNSDTTGPTVEFRRGRSGGVYLLKREAE